MNAKAQACLRKMYAKFSYIPPQNPDQPANCKNVIFTKDPDIRIFTGQISKLEGQRPDEIIGVTVHCVTPILGLPAIGGFILLLQVSAYIEWEVGFVNKQNKYVTETHRLFVSLPLFLKLAAPRMALMAVSAWQVRILNYVNLIAHAFAKLEEMEKTMAKVVQLKKGFCPEDIRRMEEELKILETQTNHQLRLLAQDDIEEIAMKLEQRGRLAGTRLA